MVNKNITWLRRFPMTALAAVLGLTLTSFGQDHLPLIDRIEDSSTVVEKGKQKELRNKRLVYLQADHEPSYREVKRILSAYGYFVFVDDPKDAEFWLVFRISQPRYTRSRRSGTEFLHLTGSLAAYKYRNEGDKYIWRELLFIAKGQTYTANRVFGQHPARTTSNAFVTIHGKLVKYWEKKDRKAARKLEKKRKKRERENQ